jgi:hypothetical protein
MGRVDRDAQRLGVVLAVAGRAVPRIETTEAYEMSEMGALTINGTRTNESPRINSIRLRHD